jgi:AcrR family transcriptional regulator
MPAPRTARAVARREITAAILEAARAELAANGAAALSLRAVAREVGMVSSAVYRYFPSRDDLLTALIVEAYTALGEVAERADAKAVKGGAGPGQRWLATARAFRRWAKRHPHEFALIYGSPVPGYAAPQETVQQAARVVLVLAGILRDAAAAGTLGALSRPLPRPLASADLRATAGITDDDDPGDLPERSLVLMTSLLGATTAELFGHLVGTLSDVDAWFDASVTWVAGIAGLTV